MTLSFSLQKYQDEYEKNAEFYVDFKFVDKGLNNFSEKDLKAKNFEKDAKTKIIKVCVIP